MAPPSASKTPPLHFLRGLYRLLKTPAFPKELQNKAAARGVDVSSKQRSNSSTAYLMSEYRQSAAHLDKKDGIAMRKRAFEYFQLRWSIAERAKLYALDAGAEKVLTPKEISRRAAARAGLLLPKEMEQEERPPLRLD